MLRFNRPAIALHWLMALLIFAAFGLGWTMVDIPGFTPTKLKYFSWHKWLGVTVLLLAAIRLVWRLTHAAPPYDAAMPRWQQNAAHGLHWLLYFLFFAVPLSGYLYSLAAGIPVVYLGIIPLPVVMEPNPELKAVLKTIHIALNKGMLVLIILHFAAAMKHQLIDRDSLLKRMLP
ncbi:MAG: hypothetical protein RL748_3043 [Pseudomonadota bacterium]|jgi:cytochrome b561